eukprot:2642370-Rhodomonas_salina.1
MPPLLTPPNRQPHPRTDPPAPRAETPRHSGPRARTRRSRARPTDTSVPASWCPPGPRRHPSRTCPRPARWREPVPGRSATNC